MHTAHSLPPFSAAGVQINETLHTSNPCVLAVGDCVAGIGRFTHLSGESGHTRHVHRPSHVLEAQHTPPRAPRHTSVPYGHICAVGTPDHRYLGTSGHIPSGEMAKMAVQNALFGDAWSVRSLVVPACTYTEPELAEVGEQTPDPAAVDTYPRAG